MPDATKFLFITSTTLSAVAAGFGFCLTAVSIPAILAGLNHATIPSVSSSMTRTKPSPADELAPRETALILTQWRKIYRYASRIAPPLFLTSAAACLANAYLHYAPTSTSAGNALGGRWGTRRSIFFMAAAVAQISVVPFTLLTMSGINCELHKREEAGRGVKGDWTKSDPRNKLKAEGTSESLIKTWGLLNGVRFMLPLIAVVLGFEAL